MDMKKYASKRFIKLEDTPRRDTIEDVTEGSYGKPVLTFKSGRRFSLNATNNDITRAAFGDDSDDWPGREVELYARETKFNGDTRATVLIRTISPSLTLAERSEPAEEPKPEAKQPPADEMDDDIPF
jgi:hypothetical protein